MKRDEYSNTHLQRYDHPQRQNYSQVGSRGPKPIADTKFAKRFMREQGYTGKLTIERDYTVRIK